MGVDDGERVLGLGWSQLEHWDAVTTLLQDLDCASVAVRGFIHSVSNYYIGVLNFLDAVLYLSYAFTRRHPLEDQVAHDETVESQ